MEVRSARVKAIVRDEVERRKKILRRLSRGEEFEDARIHTYVGAAVTSGTVDDDGTADSAPSRRTCKRRGDVGIRALSPVSTRTLDAGKYGLEPEVDGGSGGC